MVQQINVDYFITSYCSIDDKIVLTEYNQLMLSHFDNNIRSLVISDSGTGKTIMSLLYLLWYIITNHSTSGLFLVLNPVMKTRVCRLLNTIISNFPKHFKISCSTSNTIQSTFLLENNSKLQIHTFHNQNLLTRLRGILCNIVIIDDVDECKFIPDIFNVIIPILSYTSSSKLIATARTYPDFIDTQIFPCLNLLGQS